MDSSNANSKSSGSPNSSRRRLVKVRRRLARQPRSETPYFDLSEMEMCTTTAATSVFGNLRFGEVDDGAFVSRENYCCNSESNLNWSGGNSKGWVGNAIFDDMRKLRIGSGAESWSDVHKGIPDELRKLSIGGSGNANINSFLSYGSDEDVAEIPGNNVESRLWNKMKKLNIAASGEVDGDSVAGSSGTRLPTELKSLNINDSVNTCAGDKGGDFVSGSIISSGFGGRIENVISEEMGKMEIGSSNQTQMLLYSSGLSVQQQRHPGNLGDKSSFDIDNLFSLGGFNPQAGMDFFAVPSKDGPKRTDRDPDWTHGSRPKHTKCPRY